MPPPAYLACAFGRNNRRSLPPNRLAALLTARLAVKANSTRLGYATTRVRIAAPGNIRLEQFDTIEMLVMQ